MSLPKLTENLNKVSSLAEKPTLTAQQLQAVFDEAGNAIKDYINDVLTTAIEQSITSTVQANKTTVENVLTSTSTTNALSSAQGKVLKGLIDELESGKQKLISTGTSTPEGGNDGDIYFQIFS